MSCVLSSAVSGVLSLGERATKMRVICRSHHLAAGLPPADALVRPIGSLARCCWRALLCGADSDPGHSLNELEEISSVARALPPPLPPSTIAKRDLPARWPMQDNSKPAQPWQRPSPSSRRPSRRPPHSRAGRTLCIRARTARRTGRSRRPRERLCATMSGSRCVHSTAWRLPGRGEARGVGPADLQVARSSGRQHVGDALLGAEVTLMVHEAYPRLVVGIRSVRFPSSRPHSRPGSPRPAHRSLRSLAHLTTCLPARQVGSRRERSPRAPLGRVRPPRADLCHARPDALSA